MLYSSWGGINDLQVSKLGFGTTRFPVNDLGSREGRVRCVELVEYAIEKGINYFDVAPTYSNGYAESILGDAFKNTASTIYVAAKTGLSIDRSAEDLLKRLYHSLTTLNREYIDFYHIWSVMNIEQYHQIMKKGGLYEGAQKAKEQGLIKHLCISLHCSVEDTLRIVEEGMFEGITISMNAMNYRKWVSVLSAAKEKRLGVATMNSLAGGVIPRYENLFQGIDNSDDAVAIKALRFLSNIPEINVALSGMTTNEEIDLNCKAFEPSQNVNINRNFEIQTVKTCCSGCNYCSPCTVKIPIASCMQAYNHGILVESSSENFDRQKLANEIFVRVRANGVDFTDLSKCISCHACEKRCTQKLDIANRLHEMFEMAQAYGYTKENMYKRLTEIELECSENGKVGIWPAADYATRVLDFWNNPKFESRCEFFNSSEELWGKEYRGKHILSPSELDSSQVNTVIIMHYRLQDEIYNDLQNMCEANNLTIKLVKLHSANEIDWFNRMV